MSIIGDKDQLKKISDHKINCLIYEANGNCVHRFQQKISKTKKDRDERGEHWIKCKKCGHWIGWNDGLVNIRGINSYYEKKDVENYANVPKLWLQLFEKLLADKRNRIIITFNRMIITRFNNNGEHSMVRSYNGFNARNVCTAWLINWMEKQ